MMDKFSKILEIFESQKDEISKMSNKINDLEKTNSFLMKFIQTKNDLSAVYDLKEIQRYKQLAMDRELTLNTAREKAHIDATICDTSLSSSFECADKSECRKSFESYEITPEGLQLAQSKPYQMKTNGNIPEDAVHDISYKTSIGKLPQSKILELRKSNLSPVHREVTSNRNILGNNEPNDGYPSSDRSQSSDEKKNTVIARSIPDVTRISKDLSLSNNSDKYNIKAQTSSSHNTSEQVSCSINPLNSDDDNKLKDAIDQLITTLEQRKSRLHDSTESSFSEQLKQITHPPSIHQLLSTKESILSDLDNKHTQMKLLLSSQQLKADLFHKSLKSNNDNIVKVGYQIIQNNSSNKIIKTQKEPEKETKVKAMKEQGQKSGTIITLIPNTFDFKSRRQSELNRLNSNIRDQLLRNPQVKRGFDKFTALIKGYIVRTLLETDKVRSVIMTIKDTALMALKIRQERLSGDCAQPGDISYNNRRNNQEVISFQSRLLSQLRRALNELHEIFFVWPSHSRISLLRSHINQIISSATKYPLLNEDADQGGSIVTINKVKKAGQLSSATVKRRQNMALRRSEGNFKLATKENGNTKSSSASNQRKFIYSNLYGCRGHAVGSSTRSSNGQSKNGADRRSRPNNTSHRRNTIRNGPDVELNALSSNPKPHINPAARDNTKQDECGDSKTMSNVTFKVTKKDNEQQQQRRLSTKTITTSICSQASGDGHPYKRGFITAMLGKKNCVYDTINVHRDSQDKEVGDIVPKMSILLPDHKESQANTNNFDGGSDKNNVLNSRSIASNHSTFDDHLQSPGVMDSVDDMFSKVEVDIGELECAALYRNNCKSKIINCPERSEYSDYSKDSDNVVLVDINQRSVESESTYNDLRSTFNSDTNHCINKPTVTTRNTKYTPNKPNPTVVAVPLFSKHIPLPIPSHADFDFSSSTSRVLPYRTFKIKKRIIACSNKE